MNIYDLIADNRESSHVPCYILGVKGSKAYRIQAHIYIKDAHYHKGKPILVHISKKRGLGKNSDVDLYYNVLKTNPPTIFSNLNKPYRRTK